MRKMLIGVAALLVSACGGEVYPIAPTQAFLSLSSIGTPPGVSSLPGALGPVSVHFESVPGDNLVQWAFTHDGDDLARIVARVTPDGDAASYVTVQFVEGAAPDDRWRNKQARRMLKTHVQQLIVEAVDSKLENRPYDEELKRAVTAQVYAESMGSMMDDVSSSLNEHVAKEKQYKAEAQSRRAANPYNATKPSTDLSKFN